jgi:head-tail adaptor
MEVSMARRSATRERRIGRATAKPDKSEANDKKEIAMQETAKPREMFDTATTKALDTMTMWAEANQRVLRELVELSAGAAKETIRLYGELQQNTLDAMREGQSAAARWQGGWPEGPKDPAQWYQKAVADSVDRTQKAFRVMETNAQAVSRSAERLQASAEQAGKNIQETFSSLVTKTKDLYAAAR